MDIQTFETLYNDSQKRTQEWRDKQSAEQKLFWELVKGKVPDGVALDPYILIEKKYAPAIEDEYTFQRILRTSYLDGLQAPAQPAPGGSVVRFTKNQTRPGYRCSEPGEMSGDYVPAAQVAELVAALKEAQEMADNGMGEWSCVVPPHLPANIEVLYDIRANITAALARFEGQQ